MNEKPNPMQFSLTFKPKDKKLFSHANRRADKICEGNVTAFFRFLLRNDMAGFNERGEYVGITKQ